MSSPVLLITGASSGIGEATARHAVAKGWRVALLARSAAKLSDLVEELGREQALALPCDVTSEAEQRAAVAATLETFGRLDAAFANAGAYWTQQGVEAGDTRNWRTMIDVNVWGLLITAKTTLPALREHKGHFLMTGSNAGRRDMAGSVYGATKWFVTGFAQNLRLEIAAWGGRCTVLEPGFTETGFFEKPGEGWLKAHDVAASVLWALEQPYHVNLDEIRITPTSGMRG